VKTTVVRDSGYEKRKTKRKGKPSPATSVPITPGKPVKKLGGYHPKPNKREEKGKGTTRKGHSERDPSSSKGSWNRKGRKYAKKQPENRREAV